MCEEEKPVPILQLGFNDGDNKKTVCRRNLCEEGKEKHCDLKVVVAWRGTDAEGKRLSSNLNRLVDFMGYYAADLYSAVLDLDGDSGKAQI